MNKALVKKLDTAFSLYVRKRDSKDGYFRCCSCGAYKPYEQADAGHFINRKWMPIRWDEKNVHAQCSACNRFDEGNMAGYSLFMLDKYGKETIEYLQAAKHNGYKYTDFELELLIADYKQRVKEIRR